MPLRASRWTRASGGSSDCLPGETMNTRTWTRVLIAVLCAFSGLVDTLSATGLVVELSPDGLWGPGVHTLAVSGPLQIAGAALLVFGRKTRWALCILGVYVFLVSVLGDLPLIFRTDVSGSAIAGLLGNLAVMGGILYWLHSDRRLSAQEAKPALPTTNAAPAQVACHTAALPGRFRSAHGIRLRATNCKQPRLSGPPMPQSGRRAAACWHPAPAGRAPHSARIS
jgi:hypothetical protein